MTTTDEIIQSLLARPIAFNPMFARIAGSAAAGIMLSQAWYWTPRAKNEDGWFYKTMEEWGEETGLSRSEQETARKNLQARGLLLHEKRGMPAKIYYRVDKEAVLTAIQEGCNPVCRNPANSNGHGNLKRGRPANMIAETSQTGLPKSGKQERRNPANKVAETLQTCLPKPGKDSENTTESTKEIIEKTTTRAPPKTLTQPEADVVAILNKKSSVPIRPVENTPGCHPMPLSAHGMTAVGNILPDATKIVVPPASVAPAAADPVIIQALIQAGVDAPQAPRLALCSDPETIMGQIDAWRAGAFGAGVGALVQAIRRHWREDGPAKQKADDTAKKRREAIQSRALHNREDRERRERESRLEAWRALPDDLRATVERQARARLSTMHLVRGKDENSAIFQVMMAGSIAFVMEQRENTTS